MGTAQDLNGRQAESFMDARNAVRPVPPQPTAPDPWAAVNSPGEVTTYRQQVVEFNAANQHNVDVLHRRVHLQHQGNAAVLRGDRH